MKVIYQVESNTPNKCSNAEAFRKIFGLYATELWSMSENNFLEWLNAEYNGDNLLVIADDGKWVKLNHTWRDDPVTEKQLAYIMEMWEFSEYPIPPFVGKTKGEASDYIDKYAKRAHERVLDRDDYGDSI